MNRGQVVPELFLDSAMVYFEVRAGLGRQIEQYWRHQYTAGIFFNKAMSTLIVSLFVGIALLRW